MYNQFRSIVVAAAVLAGTSAYAATHKDIGTVSERVGLNEAVVDLGTDQVKVGDKVNVYEQTCEDRLIGKGMQKFCTDRVASQGEVINAGRRASIIRLENSNDIEAGDSVKLQ